MGLYPNRRVLDASFSVAHQGTQYSLHASRLAPEDRGETRAGPIEVEVVEPFRALRVRVAPNEHGIEADLVFRARAPMIEEPRVTFHVGTRAVLDATRFTQHGTWEGTIRVAGASIDVRPQKVYGVRDRSWGLRPIGEPEGGAPGMMPRVFWLWAPVHFDDGGTLAGLRERGRRRRITMRSWFRDCADRTGPGRGPEDPARSRRVSHRVRWPAGDAARRRGGGDAAAAQSGMR